jgi:hypothetical protein
VIILNNDNINKYDDENNFNYDSYYMRQQPLPPFGPPFGEPFRPPFAPPFGPPFEPPFGFPPGQQRPPIGPPPRFIPQRQPSIFAVDPGAIRPCQFRFVYIWLRDGREFWAFLIFVGRRSVAGFRWTGFNWVYFGTDLRNIDSFICF